MITTADAQVQAALRIANDSNAAAHEKALMLVEIAVGLQSRPRAPSDFEAAATLYRQALLWAQDGSELERMRIQARLATALSMSPAADRDSTQQARELLEQAIPVLRDQGQPAEWAEAELNLGLAIQTLAADGAAELGDAIAAYQRALKVFQPPRYVAEFAILHNNLATAYLAGASTHAMREALAVQSFEAALKHVDDKSHPREYAMLQNNLGNALQYAASGHALENNLRALKAYEAALEIRSERDSPLEFANTLANLGLCLSHLPHDCIDEDPRVRARDCWERAECIYRRHGALSQARIMSDNLKALDEHPL